MTENNKKTGGKWYEKILDTPKTYHIFLPHRPDKIYFGIYLEAGSLSETENLQGIGHLLEHYLVGVMTKKYGDKFETNGYIDKNHLVLNISSDREGFEENLFLFLREISEVTFDNSNIFKAERQSINNEINIKKNDLFSNIERLTYKNIFKEKIYWQTIIDQEKNNNKLDLKDLEKYYKKILFPSKINLFISGKKMTTRQKNTASELIKKYLNLKEKEGKASELDTEKVTYNPSKITRVLKQDLQGIYITLSFPDKITWPKIKKRISLSMIKKILHGYSKYSAFPKLRDAGIYEFLTKNFSTRQCGTISFCSYLEEDQVEPFLKIFSQAIKEIKNNVIDTEFIKKKKKDAINENEESWANNDDRLNWIINDLMDFGEISGPEKDEKEIMSLRDHDISNLAREIFLQEDAHILFYGNELKINDKKILKLLNF